MSQALTAAAAAAAPLLPLPDGPARWPVDLQALRQQVAGLPAWPQAVREAQQMLARDGASLDSCADCIARDAAITARLLRLANSPFYGRAGRVATVHDAIMLLGRRTLGTLLTTAAVAAGIGALASPGHDFQRFWRHTLATAVAAQALAAEQGSDEALAHSAGLLHDIGTLALLAHCPAAMAATLAWAQDHGLPRHRAEQQLLGVDHAQVGALIAAHWHFPPAVVAAIGEHHAPVLPAHAAAGAAPGLAALVQLANVLADALEAAPLAGPGGLPADSVAPVLWQRCGLAPAAVARVLQRTAQGMAELTQGLAA